MVMSWGIAPAKANEADHIQPYSGNPFYWQYKGEPVLLLGGSGQDNLFNHPAGLEPGDMLEKHLDILQSVGGNYVRNTMSHRNEGNVFPYQQNTEGKFDLNKPNPEYWNRFETLLKLTAGRDIIVQIELWATYDYDGREPHDGAAIWAKHPFNPANNVNYTEQDTTLLAKGGDFPGHAHPINNPFFHTVPARNNDTVALKFQQAFVDKILEHTLKYGHVLYCMDNETFVGPEWSDYWCGYIQKKAAEAGKKVETTQMRARPDGSHIKHHVDRPELYTYLEVSQNNRPTQHGLTMQEAYDHLLWIRGLLRDSPRPMNNTKIYGYDPTHPVWGNGVQKFWRNLMAGCASVRFHRLYGSRAMLGLGEKAQANIRSARMLFGEFNIFTAEPGNNLLSGREENEAYLLAEVDKQYALYFPAADDLVQGDGAVTLDLSGAEGRWRLRWLNIAESRWADEQTLDAGDRVQIRKPDDGHWAAVILPAE
jgi:hypothetical protein